MVPPPKNHRIHLAFNKATLSCAKTGVRCSAAIPRIRRLFLPVSDSSHQLGSAAVKLPYNGLCADVNLAGRCSNLFPLPDPRSE